MVSVFKLYSSCSFLVWTKLNPTVIRNTDYILVPKEKLETAVQALETDGWKFADRGRGGNEKN